LWNISGPKRIAGRSHRPLRAPSSHVLWPPRLSVDL
jgi:hypothetical protein